MIRFLLGAALLAGALGCTDTSSDSVRGSASEPDEIRYEPFRAFYDIPCSDASDMVLSDMTQAQTEMGPDDISPYIYAFGTRYEECQEDKSYVDDYLGLMQAAGWSGRYNQIFADFSARFPDQRNRSAMSDSVYVPPGRAVTR